MLVYYFVFVVLNSDDKNVNNKEILELRD